MSKGQPPALLPPERRKYLEDKLSDVRKSCEWLVTLGAADIFGTLLKPEIVSGPVAKWGLVAAVLGILAAVPGAMATLDKNVDPAQVEQVLIDRLRLRYHLRNVSLFFLVAAFGLLAGHVLL